MSLTLAIISESRKDDNRTPLTPKQATHLLKKFSNLKIIVEPSKNRCFKDEDYLKAGGVIKSDISEANIILGVKEVNINKLIANKTYLFFSHTIKMNKNNSEGTQGTPGVEKKELLKEIIRKNITLIDYENIRDNSGNGYRYLGFGRFAGIVGCYNTINLHLKMEGKKSLPRAFELNNYEKLKEIINDQKFKKLKIILTGDGRVAKGSLEFFKHTNIKQVSVDDYLNNAHTEAVFCNLKTHNYVERYDNQLFSLQDFILNPDKYKSTIKKYLMTADMLIASHYWDPSSPKLFSKNEIKEFKNLKIIGDITCDINGSIPTTIRSTSIQKPYYSMDINSMQEINFGNNGLAVMAVDNLPSELPKESSEEFGNALTSNVLPYIINKDDGRIKKATIVKEGKLTAPFIYLKDFIK